jgi:hypothetical protein
MSDGLPTGEQLRRIERGVRQRIDRRRTIARRVAGASAAVLLVTGGIALVRPSLSMSGGSSASSGQDTGAGGTSAERSQAVICHTPTTTTKARAARDDLPASAFAACSAALATAVPSTRPNALEAPSPTTAPTAVLCESTSGLLHVYLGDARPCAAHDLRPVEG